MDSHRPTAAERERAEHEEAQRRTRLSLRLGGLGVLLLFVAGLGALVYTDVVIAFLGVMVVGILLLVSALLLVRGFPMRLSPAEDRTKLS